MPLRIIAAAFSWGKEMADIYGTVDGFIEYHEARGRVAALAFDDDDEINAALLVASEWIDARYREAFPGYKVGGRDQVREWPRGGAYDIYRYAIAPTVIPKELISAAYEAALQNLLSPGSLSVNYVPNKYDQVSVDGAISVTFAKPGSAAEVQTQFTIVNELLAPILSSLQGTYSANSGSSART